MSDQEWREAVIGRLARQEQLIVSFMESSVADRRSLHDQHDTLRNAHSTLADRVDRLQAYGLGFVAGVAAVAAAIWWVLAEGINWLKTHL